MNEDKFIIELKKVVPEMSKGFHIAIEDTMNIILNETGENEQKSELIIHGKDCKIRDRDSHGHDHSPSKG